MLQGLINLRGEEVPFAEVDISRGRELFGMPPLVLELIIKLELENWHRKNPDQITVSDLLICLREAWLRRKWRYFANPRDLWFLFRGSVTHAILEKCESPGWIKERRVWKEVPGTGIEISGQVDAYEPETRTLVDHKTARDWKVRKLANGEKEDPHYRWQLSIYRWLLAGGRDEQGSLVNLPVERAEVYHISFAEVATSIVDLYTLEETEEFLRPRVIELGNALRDGTPPPIRPEVRALWNGAKCKKYCPVRSVCARLAGV